MAAGMVKMNHHAPIMKSTMRRDNVVLDMDQITTIAQHWRNRPAL